MMRLRSVAVSRCTSSFIAPACQWAIPSACAAVSPKRSARVGARRSCAPGMCDQSAVGA